MIACVLGPPTSVSAATFEVVSGSSIGCSLKITGLIEQGDAVRLKKFLGEELQPDGRVCFDSPGGSFVEGLRLAEEMRGGTGVDEGDLCESACFLAFMAGAFYRMEDRTPVTDRVMHPYARVGFHSPSLSIQSGQYTDAEVSKAYALALLSIAELVRFRESRPTYVFRDMLLDEMLRVSPDTMRLIETVGDAALFDITVAPVELPGDFSDRHAAQACKALGRVSEDFEMTEEYANGMFKLDRSNANMQFTAFFNAGESSTECRIYYGIGRDREPPSNGMRYAPDWSVAQAEVTDWYIDQNDFEVSAYMHYPFETKIKTLTVSDGVIEINPELLSALSANQPKSFLSCWVFSSAARVINVLENVNLRSEPNFAASIVRVVPLSEVVQLPRSDNILVTGEESYRQACMNSCQAFANYPEDVTERDRAGQCIDNNSVWYEAIDSRGNRGWISRKFLQELK